MYALAETIIELVPMYQHPQTPRSRQREQSSHFNSHGLSVYYSSVLDAPSTCNSMADEIANSSMNSDLFFAYCFHAEIMSPDRPIFKHWVWLDLYTHARATPSMGLGNGRH